MRLRPRRCQSKGPAPEGYSLAYGSLSSPAQKEKPPTQGAGGTNYDIFNPWSFGQKMP